MQWLLRIVVLLVGRCRRAVVGLSKIGFLPRRLELVACDDVSGFVVAPKLIVVGENGVCFAVAW